MDLEPLFGAVKDAIRAVWPETVANGIHESEQEMTIAYVSKTLPFASICVGPWNPAKWGVANYVNQAQLSLCYTARQKGPSADLRAKANLMERYLRANRILGSGQIVMATMGIGYGRDVSANMILNRTNMTQRVVAVRTMVVVGESYNPPIGL